MASPVIIFPGLDSAGTLFQPLMDRWRSEGRPVLLADLPEAQEWLSEADSLSRLANLTESWLNSVGAEKADIIGESFGSVSMFAFYERFPKRVESITLLGGFAWLPSRPRRVLFWALYPLFLLLSFVVPTGLLNWLNRLFLPAVLKTDPPWLHEAARAMESPPARVLLSKVFLAFRSDARPLLPKIEVPVRIIHGSHDQIVSFRAAVEMDKVIPESQLVAIESQGHLSFHARHDLLADV